MAKAIQAWRGGIHSLVELAVRGDGVLFRRVQNKSARFGYVWGSWKQIGTLDIENLPWSIDQGFSKCHRADTYTKWQNWRLPNA